MLGVRILLAVGGLVGWVQAASALTLGGTVQLPKAGLRFSAIAEIPMLPTPTPNAYTYTLGSETFEVYDGGELWRSEQLCALFTNDLGRVLVAEVASLPPGVEHLVGGRYIRRADYAKASVAPGQWDNQTLAAWIASFTGLTPAGFAGLGREQAMRYPARMYTWEQQDTRLRGFLVRLPDPTRFVWFQYELPGTDTGEASRAILQSLRSIVTGTTRAAGKQADLRFQRLAATGGEGAEYEDARRRVIANIEALDDWWYVELPHYILVSNLEKTNRRLVKELQTNLEKLRERFVSLWAPVDETPEISVVRIFNTRDEYLDYVGGENDWTTGVWMPGKRELVVSPEYAGVSRNQILDTAYHEAFHQYIHYALNGLRLPTWLNEGHACLFEACRFANNGRELRIDENEDRLTSLEYLPRLGLAVDIIDLMYLSPEAFYFPQEAMEAVDAVGAVERQRGAHYATAWGLVYFLRRGAPVACPGQGYHRIPSRIAAYLRSHPDQYDAAVEHALDGIDRDRLRDDYAAFWESKRLRGQAKRLP